MAITTGDPLGIPGDLVADLAKDPPEITGFVYLNLPIWSAAMSGIGFRLPTSSSSRPVNKLLGALSDSAEAKAEPPA